jgi:CRISPR-associated exonuclease Cas4
MTTYKVYGKDLWDKLTPKIHSELKIVSNNLQLVGVIDQIEVYEKGLIPIELKTGTAPKTGIWKNHRIQLGAYALLLEDAYNVQIKEGFVIYLDINERKHIPINPFLRMEVKDLITKVYALLQSKKLPKFCDSISKCKACGIREKCGNEKEIFDAMNRL